MDTAQQAILTISLLAAFADGTTDDRERQEIRRVAESLAGESGNAQLATLYQDDPVFDRDLGIIQLLGGDATRAAGVDQGMGMGQRAAIVRRPA